MTGSDGADTVIPFNNTYGATATAEQITEGFTAWVNGELIVGTRPSPVGSQAGSASYTYSNLATLSGVYYQTVTFTEAFDKSPNVVVSITSINQGSYTKYNAIDYIFVSADNITTTGFRVAFNCNWGAYFPITINISWNASA